MGALTCTPLSMSSHTRNHTLLLASLALSPPYPPTAKGTQSRHSSAFAEEGRQAHHERRLCVGWYVVYTSAHLHFYTPHTHTHPHTHLPPCAHTCQPNVQTLNKRALFRCFSVFDSSFTCKRCILLCPPECRIMRQWKAMWSALLSVSLSLSHTLTHTHSLTYSRPL